MTRDRRLSLTAGVLFLLTFVTAIAGVSCYAPVLGDDRFILGAGADVLVLVGALLEIALVIANLGTALALLPLLRPTSEPLAVAYVVARVMECVLIVVGILSLLTVVALRRDPGAVNAEGLLVAGETLVALHGLTFLLGPGFVVGIGNGLILGLLMYRARLVPRPFALLGVIGGPLMSVSGVAVLFGAYSQTSMWSGLATLPEIVWEASLGILLIVRGLRTRSSVRRSGSARVQMQL
jgi:hypothetical protein